jgi:hypothetical protein
MSTPATPTNYRLLGPPDLLHDLMLDFQEIGWLCTVWRWQAVITAPPEDAGHTAPQWPAEITQAGLSHTDHEAACRDQFGAPGN